MPRVLENHLPKFLGESLEHEQAHYFPRKDGRDRPIEESLNLFKKMKEGYIKRKTSTIPFGYELDEEVARLHLAHLGVHFEVDFVIKNGFKSMEYNSTKFGREITKYNVCKKRKPTGNYYVFDYNEIKEFLISKKYMEE